MSDTNDSVGQGHEDIHGDMLTGQLEVFEAAGVSLKRPREDSLDIAGLYDNHYRATDASLNAKQPVPQFKRHRGSTSLHPAVLPHYVVVHRVLCSRNRAEGEDHQEHPLRADYLDVPRLFSNDTRGSPLRGKQPISDIEEYCEINPKVCMVVYRVYNCSEYHKNVKDFFETIAHGIDRQVFNKLRPWFFRIKDDGPPAKFSSETIKVTSELLYGAMDAVTALDSERLSEWNSDSALTAPYDYFYHYRHQLRQRAASILIESEQAEFDKLLNYIDETQGAHFDEVDAAFAEGKIRRGCLTKAFGPKELIVTYQDRYPQAWIAERSSVSSGRGIILHCWCWVFDGGFRKAEKTIDVPWPDSNRSVVPLTDLVAWPLRLDKSDLQQRLERRGKDFWSCRHRRFVTYVAPTKTIFELQTVRE